MKPHHDFQHKGTLTDEMVRMSIDENSTAYLMSILTDLYSDPVKAVVREYSTNARDSHVEAGIDRPIEVTLPTRLEPTLVIKDFGVGLSVEEVYNNFSKYGFSTKRDSDNVAGMLGLGCKSGLTLASQFTMIATKDGTAASVLITRDSDGAASLVVVDKWEVDPKRGETLSGVEVSIPIKPEDLDAVQRAVTEFFWFWPLGSVLVNGEQPRASLFNSAVAAVTWIDEESVAIVDQNATSYLDHDVIVMGGVPYPVALYSDDIPRTRALNRRSMAPPEEPTLPYRPFKSNKRVVAFVPMGSVNFTPSREALHMTKRTEEVLTELRDWINLELTRGVQKQIEKATCPADVVNIAREWYEMTGTQGNSILKWNGHEVPQDMYPHEDDQEEGQGFYKVYFNRANNTTSYEVSLRLLGQSRAYKDNVVAIITGYDKDNTPHSRVREWIGRFVHRDPDSQDGYEWSDCAYVCNRNFDPVGWLGAEVIDFEELKKYRPGYIPKPSEGYRVLGDDFILFPDLDAWIKDGKPVCWVTTEEKDRDKDKGGWLESYGSNKNVKVLIMAANRVEKFKRTYPDIPTAGELLTKAYEEFMAALSETERLALIFSDRHYMYSHDRCYHPYLFRELGTVGRFVDPDLEWASKIDPHSVDQTKVQHLLADHGTLVRAMEMLLNTRSSLKRTDPTFMRLKEISERYPLLENFRWGRDGLHREPGEAERYYEYVQSVALARQHHAESLIPMPMYGPPLPTPDIERAAVAAARDARDRKADKAAAERVLAEAVATGWPCGTSRATHDEYDDLVKEVLDFLDGEQAVDASEPVESNV